MPLWMLQQLPLKGTHRPISTSPLPTSHPSHRVCVCVLKTMLFLRVHSAAPSTARSQSFDSALVVEKSVRAAAVMRAAAVIPSLGNVKLSRGCWETGRPSPRPKESNNVDALG